MNNQHVQYGCGLCAPLNWRNFDASPTLRLQKLPLIGRYFSGGDYPVFPKNVEYGDIVKGLPIQPESCEAIYCSHVLEHLALSDFRLALKNSTTYLMKGGLFRFVLPDLEILAQSYLQSNNWDAAMTFMEQSYLGKKHRARGIKGFLQEWLGNSGHLWMWDFKAISLELQQTGFQKIRRAEFGDSAESYFKEVEDLGRWKDCLGIECVK